MSDSPVALSDARPSAAGASTGSSTVMLTLAREAAVAAGPGVFVRKALAALGQAHGAARLSFLVPGGEKGVWLFAGAVGIRDTVLSAGPVAVEHNVLAWVLANRTPVVVRDMAGDGRFGAPKKLRYTGRSFAVVPVVRKGKVTGILCLTETGDRRLDESMAPSLTEAAEHIASSHELLGRLNQAGETLRREIDQERLASLLKDLKPRFDGWKGVDSAVHGDSGSGAFSSLSVTDGVEQVVFTQAPSAHAVRVLPAMAAAVHGKDVFATLTKGLKSLKVTAPTLALAKTAGGLSVSAVNWAAIWHFDGKAKKIKAVAAKAAGTPIKWKEGDMVVLMNPGALPGKAAEKKVLESLLRHQREPARKIGAQVAAECLPSEAAGHLVAVFKNTKK